MGKRPVVAVVKTSAKTFLEDYKRVMALAKFDEVMDPKIQTILKLNISWQEYYPSCSSPPWQVDGVLSYLREKGFQDVVAVENMTVVTNARKGVYNNKHMNVLNKYNVPYKVLLDYKWEDMVPSKALVFGQEDISMPSMLKNAQIIHLPTLKCHGHSETTISMKNAFGFLYTVRHHYHLKIHEILVDLLRIQQEYCKSIFSVVDGSISMNGAGPRTGVPVITNYLLAGADMVAVDAVGNKMMGFDPLKIGYVKIAHDEGLGVGDPDQIDIVGIDRKEFESINFHFKTKKDPVIYFDRFFRGSFLEPLIFRTPLFEIPRLISHYYRDRWLHSTGARHIQRVMQSEWGAVWKSYGPVIPYEEKEETCVPVEKYRRHPCHHPVRQAGEPILT
ncbi:MAG: DUF362 domain-containing protein [Candidatus Ranarchaeia archaeon]